MNLWSLRKLGRVAPLRRAVRKTLHLYYRHGKARRIPLGPLAGVRWYNHRDHTFWMPLGLFEQETAQWLRGEVEPGSTFFDVGAQGGYFTLLGSRLVGVTGRVCSFEPHPENLDVLRQQVALNRLDNVEIRALALCDRVGKAEFVLEGENANSHLGAIEIRHGAARPRSTVVVDTQTLDAFIEEHDVAPRVMKIDVEGAEMLVLQGARKTLESIRPICILSTHSDELRRDCRAFLASVGYAAVPLAGFEHELVCRPPAGD